MGVAIDTVGGFITNTAAVSPATPSPGDVFTVRNFAPGSSAWLEQIIIKGGQVTTGRVISPLMHDNVRGLTIISAQAPTQFAFPQEAGQLLTAQDVLNVQLNSGGANSSVIALQNYYTNLNGAAQRLHSWSEVSPLIVNFKLLEVDCVASAVVGTWADTVINTVENLLKANTDYAVLGYLLDVACAVVAVKGADTSNLRVGGPGSVLQDTTKDYFLQYSEESGRPHIPVFNAANAPGTFVSVLDNAAGTAVKVQLVLAQLAPGLS